jgi:hypothetical protein
LVTVLWNYSFRNIKLDATTIEENKKGDVLQIQQQDSILYESDGSECITPDAEAEAEVEANISA